MFGRIDEETFSENFEQFFLGIRQTLGDIDSLTLKKYTVNALLKKAFAVVCQRSNRSLVVLQFNQSNVEFPGNRTITVCSRVQSRGQQISVTQH